MVVTREQHRSRRGETTELGLKFGDVVFDVQQVLVLEHADQDHPGVLVRAHTVCPRLISKQARVRAPDAKRDLDLIVHSVDPPREE